MNRKVKQQSFLKYLWLYGYAKKVEIGSFIKAWIWIRSQTSGSGPRHPDPDTTKKIRIRTLVLAA
jgi:hypothetical protein